MNNFPKSWRAETKPHSFCPGCGHGITLKVLGKVIDELGIQNKTVIGFDIGCSLLAGDFFEVDSLHTHHGRTIPTMVGFKKANPDAVTIGYMGDGGAYAIGAQHLVNSAMRNDNITSIVINNTLYGMTGGQAAPTTLIDEVTDTTPSGRKIKDSGEPLRGVEMLMPITSDDAYLARCAVDDYFNLKKTLRRGILNQMRGHGFSFVEVLSLCPTNWKTTASESLKFLNDKMKHYFPVKEFKNNTMADRSDIN